MKSFILLLTLLSLSAFAEDEFNVYVHTFDKDMDTTSLNEKEIKKTEGSGKLKDQTRELPSPATMNGIFQEAGLDKESIKNMDRKQLRSMISYLDGMTKQSIIKKDPKFAGNVKSLKKIKNALENYLFQMNPNCMDFLEWHEADPWSKPQAHCPI